MQKIKQEYRQFFKQHFDDFEPRLPLFYLWDIGLRFDLQKTFKNPVSPEDDKYFEECLFRAIQIFETAFNPTDRILIIINSFKWKRQKIRRGNFIFKQVKCLDFENIFFRKVNRLYDSGDKNDRWNQAIILTEIKNINYKKILTGQINTDFPRRKPSISQDVFFVNLTQKLIFNIYDDRGLDIIGNDIKTISPIFEKHKDWILEYDRERIEEQFEQKNVL